MTEPASDAGSGASGVSSTREPVKPELDGPSIARVMPALLGGDAPWLPEPLRDASAVVVLLLDGLGWRSSQEHAGALLELPSMIGGPITTVLPSSTSAALTSLTTGRFPSEHGITGIVVRVDDIPLHTLRWAVPRGGSPPEPERVQPLPPFAGRAIPVVTRAEFRGSGFTEAHLRGGRFHGWPTTSALVDACAALIASGEQLVYAYYDGIDIVSHTSGTRSSLYRRELAFADRLCGELLDALPPSVALLVTADHGQVDLDEDSWVELDALDEMVVAYSGDARCRFLSARDGAADELLEGARALVGERGWVLERARALDERWFGPPTTLAEQRIGDVVLLGRDAVFVDPGTRGERMMRSGHGSVTEDEMLVPLVAARGRAG